MTVKRYVIPTLTMLLIASQLTGCSSATSKEALQMLERGDSITIEVAEPISIEQGTEISYEWTELAQLETYEDFRFIFDDLLNITNHGANGKNGVVYVDLESNHTDNSTLYYAFMNATFVKNYWNDSDTMKALVKAIKDTYVDINTDAEAQTAILNAYFNLYPDSEPNYFNGNSTISRGEFLAGTFRAITPVQELEVDTNFQSLVGDTDNTIYAQQLADQSYLDTASKSLNADTFNGTITRAEAIYTIVKMYYADDFATVTGKESCYSDAKNGGNIAEKQKYIKYDKESETWSKPNFWKSYELSYSLQNPDKGLPEDLYKALVVAHNHDLIDSDESNWDMGLTKSEAIDLLVKVYEDIVGRDKYITNADRGNSVGEVVENTIEYADTTEKSDTATINGQLESNTTYEEYAEGTYYIKVNEDGTKEYSPYLITDAMQMEAFSGLSYDEIIKVIDTVIDNPKLYGNDEYIRFTIGSLSKRTVNLIVPKEAPVASSGSSSSSSTGNSSSSTGSSIPQQQPVQPAQPQQPVTPAPSTPSSSVNEDGLTQEQMEAIKAENEAAGWKPDLFGDSNLGNNTGEKCEDFLEHN